MLHERSEAQPQTEQQPLPPSDDPIPATEYVANLRNELWTIRQPQVFDFESFVLQNYTNSSDVVPNNRSAFSSAGLKNDTEATNNDTDIQIAEGSAMLEDDAAFLQTVDLDTDWPHPDDFLIPPPLPTTPVCDWYLPPPELGITLLSEYLVDLNTAYPLYRPHVIANHLRACYAGDSDGSAVAWVSAYVVFGLAHMLRAMSAVATPQDNELARYYLNRTYISLNGLLLSAPSLGLVQCLIGVAMLCRSTPCGRNVPDGHFLSTSMRVAQSLAYHDDESLLAQSDRDLEQERRVFWLAFINDTNTSLLSNSPTTHRREDIVAQRPEENPSDSLGAVTAAEGFWKVNIFALRVNLALLQAEAIEQVLSAKARNSGALDLELAATVVLARLREFHDHELFKLTPDRLFSLLYRSDVTHTISIEAAYFVTVYRLQSFLAFEKNYKINPFSLEGMIRLSELKDQKSYAEACRLLSLLPVGPRGDVGLYWQHHQAIAAALVTVLSYHLNNTEGAFPQAAQLSEYQRLVMDLGKLVEKSDNVELAQERDLCMSLFHRLDTNARIRGLHNHAATGEELTADTLHIGR